MLNRNIERNKATTNAEREHAKQFRNRFAGELAADMRPERPDTHTPHNHLSAEHRQRYGRCINCED
jgi:hypothetical protein